jgi:transcriptional regulator with XRE-family HTH domain
MGNARPRPRRLAEKLRQIRLELGFSQTDMHRRLETEEKILYTRISDYELDKNEPSLMTILAYARVAGVHVEDIIDDDLDLPPKLPGTVRYQGLKRKSASRKRR